MPSDLQEQTIRAKTHLQQGEFQACIALSTTLAEEAGLHQGPNKLYRCIAATLSDSFELAQDYYDELQQFSPKNQNLNTLKILLELRQKTQKKDPSSVLDAEWNIDFHSDLILNPIAWTVEESLLPLQLPPIDQEEPSEPLTAPLPQVKMKPTPSFLQQLKSLKSYFKTSSLQRKATQLLESTWDEQDPEKRKELFDQAIDLLQQVNQEYPWHLDHYFSYGEALLFRSYQGETEPPIPDDLNQALEQFSKSWLQDGSNPYLTYYIGLTYFFLGKTGMAKAYLTETVNQFEKLPEAHYTLAQIALIENDHTTFSQRMSLALGSDLNLLQNRLQSLLQLFNEGSEQVLDKAFHWVSSKTQTIATSNEPNDTQGSSAEESPCS